MTVLPTSNPNTPLAFLGSPPPTTERPGLAPYWGVVCCLAHFFTSSSKNFALLTPIFKFTSTSLPLSHQVMVNFLASLLHCVCGILWADGDISRLNFVDVVDGDAMFLPLGNNLFGRECAKFKIRQWYSWAV